MVADFKVDAAYVEVTVINMFEIGRRAVRKAESHQETSASGTVEEFPSRAMIRINDDPKFSRDVAMGATEVYHLPMGTYTISAAQGAYVAAQTIKIDDPAPKRIELKVEKPVDPNLKLRRKQRSHGHFSDQVSVPGNILSSKKPMAEAFAMSMLKAEMKDTSKQEPKKAESITSILEAIDTKKAESSPVPILGKHFEEDDTE